jgi:hypothetical protein
MLSNWGLVYLLVGFNLSTMQIILERRRNTTPFGQPLNPDGRDAESIVQLSIQILQLIEGAKHDLGAVPANIKALKDRFLHARQPHLGGTLDIVSNINDLRQIRSDFETILEQRFFYYLRPDLKELWGTPELFGPQVAKKFRDAANDIEHAGNCLALGESTACVFHLMRAMETAVRRLGERLHVTINPKDTWGKILNSDSRHRSIA